MSFPPLFDEGGEIVGMYSDRLEHSNVLELAFSAQPVDRRRADAQLSGDLPDREKRRALVW